MGFIKSDQVLINPLLQKVVKISFQNSFLKNQIALFFLKKFTVKHLVRSSS